jgi:hexokinase/sugar (pentulose or hexulose) kinase
MLYYTPSIHKKVNRHTIGKKKLMKISVRKKRKGEKKMKKVISIVVGVLFLMNNIALADMVPVRTMPQDKLAAQSHLKPLETPSLLDVMKLTAGIMEATQGRDLASLGRAIEKKIDAIDEKTTQHAAVQRPGDTLTYNLREKQVLGDGKLVFFGCSIEGAALGSKTAETRRYLCCAQQTGPTSYTFAFYSEGELGKPVATALADTAYLEGTVAQYMRSEIEKEAISRFGQQQNETDTKAREAILASNEVRLHGSNAPGIGFAYVFIKDINEGLAQDFNTLVTLGQVMVIPGLEKHHAGGVGIYLTGEKLEKTPSVVYRGEAGEFVHETFAKAGLTDEECSAMERVYAKYHAAGSTMEGIQLETDEIEALAKAKTARFANRWDNPYTVDYYKVRDESLIEAWKGTHDWYLGIDSSTQSVKFFVIDYATRKVVWSHKEEFNDAWYTQRFGATDGVLGKERAQRTEEYHTDPLMLAAALENGMQKVSEEFETLGWDIANIRAIAGAGQQHGTVYFNDEAKSLLGNLNDHAPLWMQLQRSRVFSRLTAPIWQDGSTTTEVADMDTAAGGPAALRKLTGSSGTLRFGLAQIMAFFRRHLSAYNATERVLNIAAYNGSLLTGTVDFPFDPGDAAGSNAMHLTKKTWLAKFIDGLVPGLSGKLPGIKPSDEVIGTLAQYWCTRWGFSPQTKVVNWTGDNPSALTGQGIIKKGQVTISLGTSYTMYTFLDKADLKETLKQPIGHVFGEPTGKYMKLVCFQNGDDTLKGLRNKYISDEEAIERVLTVEHTGWSQPTEADLSTKEWKAAIDMAKINIFIEEAETLPVGNNGSMMIAQHKTEDVVRIPLPATPYARGVDFGNRAQVFRAAVEGQIYFLKYVADQIGLQPKEIRLTGGVANDRLVRQVLADVFDAKVTVLQETEAVALGSAIRAMKADKQISWAQAVKGIAAVDASKTAAPIKLNTKTYATGYEEYKGLLAEAIAEAESDTTEHISNEKIVDYLAQKYHLTTDQMWEIVDAFQIDMDHGLQGAESSLAMIPTFVEPATGREKGTVVTLDVGGTNFRILKVTLEGGGKIAPVQAADVRKYKMEKKHWKGANEEDLFDFLAECIENFLKEQGLDTAESVPISFVFSFSVNQTSINSGILNKWTKKFTTKGVVGKDVVKLLNDALARRKVTNAKVVALANDTVATMQAFRYQYGEAVDSGIIISSGTNGCRSVKLPDITKKKAVAAAAAAFKSGEEIVNLEWGNFDKLPRTAHDLQLNAEKLYGHLFNRQTLEKMVSAEYLGELTRLMLLDLIERGMLFEGKKQGSAVLSRRQRAAGTLECPVMDTFVSDTSGGHTKIKTALEALGITESSPEDRVLVQKVANMVSTRSAQIAAAAIVATITKYDKRLETKHIVPLDSSLYSKHPGYKQKLEEATEQLLGERAKNVEYVTMDDATGIGAAVIGGVAARLAAEAQEKLDTTIIDTAAGEVTQYLQENKTVVFVPQGFATEDRCAEFAKQFPGAEFKSFDQNAGLARLPGQLQKYRDQGYKIAMVTMGLDFAKIQNTIRANMDAFKGVMPVNVGAEGISELNAERLQSFQKGVLTIALLARALPEKDYAETRSYMTLQSLLGAVLPETVNVDTYISTLVNTNMDIMVRFGYLINAMLKPIVPMDYEQLNHVVEVFISA